MRPDLTFDWGGFVFEQGGVRASIGRDDEYLLICPDCTKPKLAVNVARKAWRCFVCNDAGRSPLSLISKALRLPYSQAMIEAESRAGESIGRIDRVANLLKPVVAAKRIPKEIPWPDSFEHLTARSLIGLRGISYCQQRGITDHVAREMRLGVCSSGRFRDRLIFPVFDSGGRMIFYQGRAMWSPAPGERYLKTLSVKTEFDADMIQTSAGAGDCLLNLQYLIDRDQCDRVAVVEGPVDCAHAWPDAVCSFGKRLSDQQIQALMRAGVRSVDICFDPDAIDSSIALASKLADLFGEVRVVDLPPGRDPGDMTKLEIDACRNAARTYGSGARLEKLNTVLF